MRCFFKSFILLALFLILSGCLYNRNQVVPAIVPSTQKTEIKPVQPDVIGAVEPVYLLPMQSAFEARIDTGAVTSSVGVDEIKEFERDGQKWVAFTIIHRKSGETYTFEKPVIKNINIRRAESPESRFKVLLPVSFGGKKFSAEFTLADRKDFEYQALVGRNILTGKYIVDTSLSHTLK